MNAGDEPRISPASESSATGSLLAKTRVGGSDRLNLFTTLAHHPAVLERFNALGGAFMRHQVLPARDRELVILRIAMLRRSDYEWGQHAAIALHADVLPQEIAALGTPSRSWSWPDREDALLCFAEQAVETGDVDDPTWGRVAAHLDEPALVELTVLVGFYEMAALFLRVARVQPDPGLTGAPWSEST